MNGHTHSHKQLTLTLTLRHFGHETRTNCRQRHQHMIAEGRHIMQPKKKKNPRKCDMKLHVFTVDGMV